MRVVEFEGSLYQVYKANRGELRLKPIQLEKLKIQDKNDIIKHFSTEELMEEIISKANEPRNEKVIIEKVGD